MGVLVPDTLNGLGGKWQYFRKNSKTLGDWFLGFVCLFVCSLLFCILPPIEMFMFQKGKKFISVFKNRIEKLLPYTEEQGHL